VPERVGQRLLHDPVGRQVDPGRQRPRLTLHRHLDRQAGLAGRHGQGLEVGQARLGGEGGVGRLAVVVAQQPQQPAQLDQGLAAGRLDLAERGRRLAGAGGHGAAGRPGLHHHHAHRVGDDVVQLAGDPAPLGGHRPARAQLLLLGQLEVELLQLGHVAQAPLLGLAEEERGRELDEGEHPGLQAVLERARVPGLGDQAVADHGGRERQRPDHRLASGAVGGHGVERDHHGRLGEGRLEAQGQVEDGGGRGHGQDGVRGAPPPGHRHRLAEGEQHGQRPRVTEAGGVQPLEVLAGQEQQRQGDRGQQGGQQAVGHRGGQLPHPSQQ
jgi:hypothetical protein